MKNTLKLGCLIIYALALAALAGLLPAGMAGPVQWLAVAVLAAHALEVVVMFKHVRRYPGPLWVSIVLTVLFGLLHWLPLARKAAAQRRD